MTHAAGYERGERCRPLTLALAVLLPVAGCSPNAPPEFRTLSSGEQVAVLSVTDTETASGYRTLHVDYSTEIPVGDHVALAPEVEEVWATFIAQAEGEDFDAAMISPHAGDSSVVSTTFPITRGDDGEWDVPYVVSLGDGESVVVVSERTDADSLFVDYATSLLVRPDHLCALAAEVDDVWAELRDLAAAAGVKKALISPNDEPILGTSITFAFRREEGRWSRVTATHCVDDSSRSGTENR